MRDEKSFPGAVADISWGVLGGCRGSEESDIVAVGDMDDGNIMSAW